MSKSIHTQQSSKITHVLFQFLCTHKQNASKNIIALFRVVLFKKKIFKKSYHTFHYISLNNHIREGKSKKQNSYMAPPCTADPLPSPFAT